MVNHLDTGMECPLTKSADSTELQGVIDTTEGPGQAVETGLEKPHEIEQMKVQSLDPGEEKTQT